MKKILQWYIFFRISSEKFFFYNLGGKTEKLYIKRQLFSPFLILYTKNIIHFPLKIISCLQKVKIFKENIHNWNPLFNLIYEVKTILKMKTPFLPSLYAKLQRTNKIKIILQNVSFFNYWIIYQNVYQFSLRTSLNHSTSPARICSGPWSSLSDPGGTCLGRSHSS